MRMMICLRLPYVTLPIVDSAFDRPRQILLEALEEPHFMAPLDHALTNFQTDISPWTCPKDWIDADVSHVTLTIQEFVASTQSAEIEDANFRGNMVYQVCLSYNIYLVSVNTDCSV
jgi:hypothetical protein